MTDPSSARRRVFEALLTLLWIHLRTKIQCFPHRTITPSLMPLEYESMSTNSDNKTAPAFGDLPLREGDPPYSAWGLWGEDDNIGTLVHI